METNKPDIILSPVVNYNQQMRSTHSITEKIDVDRFETALEDTFARGCRHLGFELSSVMVRQMLDHLLLLRRWNKRLNLTAILSPREMIVLHLLDSLAIARLIKGPHIIDIGTGGGFPGMPLAVIYPDKQFTLLDSRGKRIEFLRHVSASIGITNVTLEKSRIQDFRPTEKFDTLVSRAFASISEMQSWSRHLQHPGARLLAMKGKMPKPEIDALPGDLKSRVRVEAISVPFSQAERHGVIIDF